MNLVKLVAEEVGIMEAEATTLVERVLCGAPLPPRLSATIAFLRDSAMALAAKDPSTIIDSHDRLDWILHAEGVTRDLTTLLPLMSESERTEARRRIDALRAIMANNPNLI